MSSLGPDLLKYSRAFVPCSRPLYSTMSVTVCLRFQAHAGHGSHGTAVCWLGLYSVEPGHHVLLEVNSVETADGDAVGICA